MKHHANRAGRYRPPQIDFPAINAAALRDLPTLLARWLPDGRAEGHDWVARYPRSANHTPANDTGKTAPSVEGGVRHDR